MKTVMETIKEMKIIPPEGFEIDRENSTFDCIKFKPIEIKRWRDDKEATFDGYYIGIDCTISRLKNMNNTSTAYNVFATEKQAKSAIAMARISQIMANDKRFGGTITDEEWENVGRGKYAINRSENCLRKGYFTSYYHFLAFHTKQQCDLFLKENEDLVKDYLMI